MSLSDAFEQPEKRQRLIDDAIQLVEDEVAKKKGLGGMVIKGGYKAVKGVSPGFIRKVVNALFGKWAAKLDPIWQQGVDAGGDAQAHFSKQRSQVADALLSVTDEKVLDAKSGVVASTYKKLRPSAKKHVEEAVPGLAALLAKYAG